MIDGICAQIDNREITIEQLMQHIKGPDFPTGCMILGLEGIKNYFKTGRGSIRIRGKVGIEEHKEIQDSRHHRIPYNVNHATGQATWAGQRG